jgi:hypothetical protein
MERVRNDGGKGVVGVDQQPCVTGIEMFDDLKVLRGGDSFSKCTNPKVAEILYGLRKRENALYKKTGFYVTGDEMISFNNGFVFTSSSRDPETRDKLFNGKTNPEVEGAKYFVGTVAVWGGVEVIIYMPYMEQKEPYLVFARGSTERRNKKVMDVVKSYAARYNDRLDELEAGKLEKRK